MMEPQRGTVLRSIVDPIAPTEVNPLVEPSHVHCLDPDWTWMSSMTHVIHWK